MRQSEAIYLIRDTLEKIDKLNEEINFLNKSRRVAESYMSFFSGVCNECGNNHWPPCGKTLEDYL